MSAYQRCEVTRNGDALELRVTLIHSDATLPMPGDKPNLLRLIAERGGTTLVKDPYDEAEIGERASELIESASLLEVDVSKGSATYRVIPTAAGQALRALPLGTWDAAADVDCGTGEALLVRGLWRDPQAAIALGQQGDALHAECFVLMLTDRRPGIASDFRRSALIALGWIGPAALPLAEEPLYSLVPGHSLEELAHTYAEWRVLGNEAAKARVFKTGNNVETLNTILFEAPCALLEEHFAIAATLNTYLNATRHKNRAMKRCGLSKK